jgi:hypothetical protein
VSIPRLLGHSFGDGYIHINKFYFVYTNTSEELLKLVVDEVRTQFGTSQFCERKSVGGTPQVQFPAFVGRRLHEIGAPRGPKSLQKTTIPDSIMRAPESVKADFLGALCDDEANIRPDIGSKQITIKAAKLASLEPELDDYLNQIRRLFEDLGIKCSQVRRDRTYVRRGQRKISKRIWITSRTEFATFARKIVLNHDERRARLKTLLMPR